MTNDTDKPITEAQAFADLIRWGKTRCAWQQDALATLIEKDQLSTADIDSLEKTCLDPSESQNLLPGTETATMDGDSEPISLSAIEAPKGINALVEDQALVFGSTGLTVVYGDNGAGKSGYVRILKNACRTRDGDIEILRNVEDPEISPQSALIRYRRGDTERDFQWSPSTVNNEDLPSVSIFDSSSANIHVEKTNAVAYIPRPMQVLESLASCCDEIKKRLATRIRELRNQTPASVRQPNLNEKTAAGAFVHNLSAKSTESQLAALSIFDDEDRNRQQALTISLSQSDNTLVATLRGQKTRLDDGAMMLSGLVTATSESQFRDRDRLIEHVASTAEAESAASTSLFSNSELPGIGQEAWTTLWEAARLYSDSIAYSEQSFPVLDEENSLCVLCHQPVGESVLNRWGTFEEHIKGSTRRAAKAAEAALSAWKSSCESAGMKVAEIRALYRLIKDELGELELADKIRRSCLEAAWRHRSLLRGGLQDGSESNTLHSELLALSSKVECRISELILEEGSPEKVALQNELMELNDREKLALLRDDVKAEIGRLGKIQKIERAQKDTAKNSITIKNKELTDQIVTNALRGRFAREIEKLNLTAAPVELRKVKDASAVSYFQVGLVENPNEPVGKIFSEGEHRCVALAAFLAELVTSRDYSAIVFDDPMSSLDHIHRKSVAARLVQEARHRQVIVFTHDLAFLYELRREANNLELGVHYQTVSARNGRPGYIAGELPTKAKSARQLVNGLRHEMKSAKGQFDQWKESTRVIFVKGLIEQLRETWEQGIADFIYPVLGRFENSVKGSSLFRLEVLTEQDVELVTEARGRLSEGLHSPAHALNPSEVSYQQLQDEITILEDWLIDIGDRQKQAKKPTNSYGSPI